MSSPPVTPEQLFALPPEMGALMRSIIDHYERRIADLEARLHKTPQHSSLPPSMQHPHAKPPTKRTKSKKQRGGRPGHPKHERPLIPTDECDNVESFQPTECRRCGTKLVGRDQAPLRHQVWEVPPIKPQVTEYQRHRLVCVGCGETTCGTLPPGVPTGQAVNGYVETVNNIFKRSIRLSAPEPITRNLTPLPNS